MDLERNIRADRTSWVLGYETDMEVHLGMLALHGRHPKDIEEQLSNRRKEPLIFDELRCDKSFPLEWKYEEITIANMKLKNWLASNNMNIFSNQNGKYSLYQNTNEPKLLPLSEHLTLEEAQLEAQVYFDKHRKKFSSLNWKQEAVSA